MLRISCYLLFDESYLPRALKLDRILSEYANGTVLHAALHEAQICVGQSDSVTKGPRRRPAQGGCDDLGFGKCSAVYGTLFLLDCEMFNHFWALSFVRAVTLRAASFR